MTRRTFDFASLERYLCAHFGSDKAVEQSHLTDRLVTDCRIALILDVNRRTAMRWRHQGWLPCRAADRAAIRISAHPIDIWPNYYDDIELVDEQETSCV